ncbi:MAG: hypothetical protein HY741_06860 [Chloroflexi bacterium]|nr:hypothetical protein [Chloroflexota bacterium]
MKKHEFLQKIGVTKEPQAMSNSLTSAVQHNPTYTRNLGTRDRERIRARWASLIRNVSPQYNSHVNDAVHVQNISSICDVLTSEFSPFLRGQRFRFGTSQKALNLYLKFFWCLDEIKTPPPHCPVDRTVLTKAGIVGNWTQLDSVELYMQWISKLRAYASKNGYTVLQEWELAIWDG